MSYAVLLVLATLVFGRRFLGREGGWVAAIVLVAIPIFPIWSALANADMAWAVYEFLGVYAMILWLKTRRHEWLALSGLVIGLSLGSKYLALGNTCVLALFVIYNSRREGLKRMIRNAAVFGGIALFVGSPWYLKNWLWTGNPVYPLYFGGPAWPTERVRLLMSFLNSFGTGHRVLDYLLLPWNIYAQNQRFSTAGFPIEIPSLLFLLLLFYPVVHHKKIIHILAVIVLIRLVVWATGPQQIRFLLPAYPGLSLLVASIFIGIDHTFIQKRGGYILRTGLLGGVTVASLYISSTFFGVRPQGVILGNESKVSFLSRMLVDFPAITYIQKHLAPGDRALLMWHGEGFYCDKRCLPDTERGRWTFLAMAANYDIPTIVTSLREAGITHLLYIKGSANFTLQNDPTGENNKAASFFLKKFKDDCTRLIFSDQASSLYKITCQS
jgi:hypothetical protein